MKNSTHLMIPLIVVCLLSMSCVAQEKGNKSLSNRLSIEKFDRNKFGELTLNTEYVSSRNDTFYLSKDKKIRIIYEDETIQVEEKEIGLPYELRKSYFTKNNQLKSSVHRFYSLSYGFLREYNEEGNLIKEKNLDENYKFSIDDLIKKMRNEYGIDIMNTNKTLDVWRYPLNKNVNKAYYEVFIKLEIGGQ